MSQLDQLSDILKDTRDRIAKLGLTAGVVVNLHPDQYETIAAQVADRLKMNWTDGVPRSVTVAGGIVSRGSETANKADAWEVMRWVQDSTADFGRAQFGVLVDRQGLRVTCFHSRGKSFAEHVPWSDIESTGGEELERAAKRLAKQVMEEAG